MKTGKNFKKIDSLTGLRFVMIMTIVLRHFEFLGQVAPINEYYPKYWSFQVLGVDFFFILSGFGMMYGNLRSLPYERLSCPNYIDCLRYGIGHIRRIYPLYITTIIIGFFLSLYFEPFLGVKYEILRVILVIPLIQSTTGMMYFSHAYNGVAWFLSSLFCIYLVSPYLMYFLRKISKQALSVIVLFFVFVSIVVTVSFLFGLIQNYANSIHFHPLLNTLVVESPIIRVFYVLCGMCLAIIFNMMQEKCSLSKELLGFFEFFLLIMAVFYYSNRNDLFQSFYYNAVDVFFAAGFVFVFAFEKGILSRCLKHQVFQKLGNMSMYIFLVHYPIRIYCGHFLERYVCGWSVLSASLFILFELATTFYISWILSKNK